MKNAASRRLVPAHSGLVALGFLQYVVERRAAGDRRLFPDLRKTGHGYGQSVSRWFGEWRRERGITSHLTPLHSFRNTVISRLRAAGVPLDVVQEITGHENDSVTISVYAQRLPVARLREVIEKLDVREGLRDLR